MRFFTDSGRVQRPLFIVKNSEIILRKDHIKKLQSRQNDSLNFDDTLKMGLCEFVDVEEEETAMIAMHISDLRNKGNVNAYTHCEIHPSMILGVCASIIPSRITTSHLVTPIKVPWANKQWACTQATIS